MSAIAPVETPPPLTHSPGPAPWRWSRADYHRLGEQGFFRGKRVELIRGEIVTMSPMDSPRWASVALVADALRPAFGPGFAVVTQVPLALAGSEPEPDAAVVRGGPRDYAGGLPTTALLVVEVPDSTLHYDTTTKVELYAAAGVPDYWVVDLNARALLVFRDPRPLAPGGHTYQSRTAFGPADSVVPLAAPGSTVRVADLLP